MIGRENSRFSSGKQPSLERTISGEELETAITFPGWSPSGALRIVVPGQFEKDKSVTLGGAGIRTNLELLQRVRCKSPLRQLLAENNRGLELGIE